jgi:hypothetical protein
MEHLSMKAHDTIDLHRTPVAVCYRAARSTIPDPDLS